MSEVFNSLCNSNNNTDNSAAKTTSFTNELLSHIIYFQEVKFLIYFPTDYKKKGKIVLWYLSDLS